MPFNDSLFSSKSLRWGTPDDFFHDMEISLVGKFDIDTCATKETTKCEKFFEEDEGLEKSWHGKCFMNPPYGREISKWVEKAHLESRNDDCEVVGLIPSRTDTKWWHEHVMKANVIYFVKGRLKFIDHENGKKSNSAPFPSAVVVWWEDRDIHEELHVCKMERSGCL